MEDRSKHLLTCAEILACALTHQFPQVQLVGAGVTPLYFYYDFFAPHPVDQQMLTMLEEKMRGIIKEAHDVRCLEMVRTNAADLFRHHKQAFLAEEVLSSSEDTVTVFQLGTFYDYTHTEFSLDKGDPKGFKLLEINSFDDPERGVPLYRITGTVSKSKDELKKTVALLKEQRNLDHKTLCREMDLIAFLPEMSSSEPVWLPKGATLRHALLDQYRALLIKEGFDFLDTPLFVNEKFENKLKLPPPSDLTSLYPLKSAQHAALFSHKLHSYRELPVKYAEFAHTAPQYHPPRHQGLLSHRLPLVDHLTILCDLTSLEKELISFLQFFDKFAMMFGLKCHWRLFGRGRKYSGTVKQWNQCLAKIEAALSHCQIPFSQTLDKTEYDGPKIECTLVDTYGREWPGPSIQLNFTIPERMGLRVHGTDDEMHLPLMLTASAFGSLERFIAILLEHYKGWLPLWLAPEQVRIITVNEENVNYAKKVSIFLKEQGVRVNADFSNDQLGKKLHQAQQSKVPYLVVIGNKEEKENKITLRKGLDADVQKMMLVEELLRDIIMELQTQ